MYVAKNLQPSPQEMLSQSLKSSQPEKTEKTSFSLSRIPDSEAERARQDTLSSAPCLHWERARLITSLQPTYPGTFRRELHEDK